MKSALPRRPKGAIAMRRTLIRAALASLCLALLGFVLPGWRIISKLSEVTLSAAYVSQISMMVVCLAFVLMGVRSFINARKG